MLSVIDLANGQFVRVNPDWTKVLGFSAEEFIGHHYVEFIHPDDVDISLAGYKTGVDPDVVARPLITFGVEMDVQGDFELESHIHAKAQLLLGLHGVITCEIDGGLWIVPPQSALWIPGGETHAIPIAGKVHGYGALIGTEGARRLPSHCCEIFGALPGWRAGRPFGHLID